MVAGRSGSAFAAVYMTGDNGVRYQARLEADVAAVSDSSVATPEQIALREPVWVKIERVGNALPHPATLFAIFAFGLIVHKGPRICGVAGLLTNIIAYPALKFIVPDVNFLNRMAVCFFL